MDNIFIKFIKKYKLNELKWLDLIWLLIFPILNLNYLLAGKLAQDTKDFTILLDKEIPFVGAFIYPYIYWYVYIFAGLFLILLKDRRKYFRILFAIAIGMCVCYVIYFLYPVEIARPVIASNDITGRLVNMIYSADRPVNCFPSIHVLNTYIMMRLTVKKGSHIWNAYTYIVGILIILSTLFIKQHYVLDGVAGIVLGEIVVRLAIRLKDIQVDYILNLPYNLIYKLRRKDSITASENMSGEI